MFMKKNRIYIAVITAVASLGGFLFGFDMAVVSGILPLVQQQFDLSAVQEGWFVSSALIGCIFGVAVSGELSDRFGRKIPLFLSSVLFLLSALGCAAMPSLFGVILFRIMGGIGIGIASNVVPLYISEIAPPKIRGRLVTYYQFALTFGILVAYITNSLLLDFAQDNNQPVYPSWLNNLFTQEVWRGMFGIGVIPALLFFGGLSLIPESPRWLIQKGRIKEGELILTRITNVEEARAGAKHISQNLTEQKVSYKELFAPGMRKALLIGVLLPLFSQFSGINAIIYYGPSILNDAGISLSNSLFSQVIFGAANMLFTLIAIWKVDSLGRRPLYLAGTAGAAVSLFLTGLCFYTDASSMLLLICVLLFLACFAFSIGPLKFVIASEIFPNQIRGRAMALSIMVMWIADTIVGQLTPILLREFGTAYTFWFFSLFCLIAFVTVLKLLPETKGKSLEEIEDYWKSNKMRSYQLRQKLEINKTLKIK